MGTFDIAVTGCGPAGLAAALLLHRDGHRVQLFERFAAPQPLGSGLMLQPSGMAVLAALGFAQQTVARGALIERLYGQSASGRTVLDARYADLPGVRSFGLGIHRASLFDVLHGAVCEAGIPIHTAHELTGSSLRANKRMLEFANKALQGPFDLVVDALGLHSPLAPACGKLLDFGALWATLPWPKDGPFDPARLEQRYRGAHEMIGVLPTGSRAGGPPELALFWSLRADRHADWLERGLTDWREAAAALWPEASGLLAAITDPQQFTFARYAHRTLPRPAEERAIHIGDAWHSASPQLGQGANMALLDAWGVAQALRLARDPALVPALTVQLRGWHVQLYQWATAFFTPLYQSDAALPPLVRDRLFAPASRWWPGKQVQAKLMSGLFGNPLERLGLTRFNYATL